MNWRHRVTWAVCVFSFASTVALVDFSMRARPEQATPRELYTVVQRHLADCRASNFPQAYHAAASSVQERYSLVQYELEIRRAYQPVAGTEHIEFGAIHHWRDDPRKATVDVYFIAHGGEAVGWSYILVFEDGDWKVDHGEPMPNWPAGRRLGGLQI